MLLNILNLPYNVKYSEIKDLVRSKCGITEIILDNLVPHDNRTKKITIGLAGEDDAAIFVRKMNGINMNGHRLQVVPKSKIPSLSNTNQPSPDMGPRSYQNPGQQASFWPQGQNYAGPPPLMGNIPTMVPPVNFGDQNTYGMYNTNQNAYPMMNQAGFETNLSTPNMGNQPVLYPSNQDYSHSSWENSNWNQQQQSGGFQHDQKQKQQVPVWDVNPRPTWDDNRNPRMNESNNSRMDNNLSSNNDRYHSNQPARSSRGHDSPYRRHERSPPSSRDRFRGDRDSSFERRPRDDRHDDRRFQDQYNPRRPRSRSPERREQHAPPPKRPRTQIMANNPRLPFAGPGSGGKLNREEMQQRVIENAKSVRGQLAATKAKALLSDKRVKYTVNDAEELLRELKPLLKNRIDKCFKNNYTIPYKEMEAAYNSTYTFKSHFVLIKEALAKVGGRLLSKAELGKGIYYQQKPVKPPSYAPVFGNQKVDHRNEPKATSSAPPKVTPQPTQATPQAPPFSRAAKKKVLRSAQNASKPPHLQATQIPPSKPGSVPLAQIPGRIPQYVEGDKKLHNKQKRELADELTNLLTDPYYSRSMNSLKPELQKAIGEELDLLAPVMESVCHPPVPDINNTEKFCDILRDVIPREVIKVMKANVVRRIVPMRPIMVRVFAVPPIKRLPLENFLKDFNISALKKSKAQPYYIATCETVADHDKLCLMKPLVDNSILTFKPFHLVEDRKIAKGAALKERKALLKEQMQIPSTNLFEVDDISTEFYEDYGAKQTKTVKTENKTEELYKEMKDLFEQINNPDQEIATNDNCKIVKDENKSDENKNSENKNDENQNGENKNDENKNDENKNGENKNDENKNGVNENVDNVQQPIKEDNYESPLKSCEGEKETEDVKTEETNEVIDNLNEEINNDQLLVVEDKVGESEKEIALAKADDIGWADVNDEDLEDW